MPPVHGSGIADQQSVSLSSRTNLHFRKGDKHTVMCAGAEQCYPTALQQLLTAHRTLTKPKSVFILTNHRHTDCLAGWQCSFFLSWLQWRGTKNSMTDCTKQERDQVVRKGLIKGIFDQKPD